MQLEQTPPQTDSSAQSLTPTSSSQFWTSCPGPHGGRSFTRRRQHSPNKGDQADVPGLLVTVHDAVRSPAAPAALARLGGALASADGVVVAVIDTRAEAEAVARDEGVEAEGLGREDDRRR